MTRFARLALFIAIVGCVAVVAGQFRPGAWYQTLAKPTWTPPGWLFGPVWGALYLMIAIAGWMIHEARDAAAARWLWWGQLALNGVWSPIMFGLNAIGPALVVIVALVMVIAALVVVSWRSQRTAAVLLLPYLGWVSFATLLNAAIWRLNG